MKPLRLISGRVELFDKGNEISLPHRTLILLGLSNTVHSIRYYAAGRCNSFQGIWRSYWDLCGFIYKRKESADNFPGVYNSTSSCKRNFRSHLLKWLEYFKCTKECIYCVFNSEVKPYLFNITGKYFTLVDITTTLSSAIWVKNLFGIL